tara:strand:+ start:523 stop:726 length:204 start_codon:yes stop_codon:yes gene_type:complete
MKNQKLQRQFKNLLHYAVASDERIFKIKTKIILSYWGEQILHMPNFNKLTAQEIEETLKQIKANYEG